MVVYSQRFKFNLLRRFKKTFPIILEFYHGKAFL